MHDGAVVLGEHHGIGRGFMAARHDAGGHEIERHLMAGGAHRGDRDAAPRAADRPVQVAGDDAFVLLPACYALDYARQFCLKFEEAMREAFKPDGGLLKPLEHLAPTMSAAVVICKSTYPYRLAYRSGAARLQDAKRLAKHLGHETAGAERLSAISFEIITGNELVDREPEPEGLYRAEMRPYWAADRLPPQASKRALPLGLLLDQRLILNNAPGKRLAEFRELYAPEALPADAKDMQENWQPRLQHLLERILATDAVASERVDWKETLRSLGDDKEPAPAHWRRLQRSLGGQMDEFYASGLPDLIEAWDYTQSLSKPLDAYKREER